MGHDTPDLPAVPGAKGFPPRLFLIGAQKCATTFFADCLARHPQIALASPKEPDFFTRNHGRGADWYRACFQSTGGEVLLDASVSYSVAPEVPDPVNPVSGVPERIRAMVPDAYFLYIVRDPVKRVHSAYWHAVTAGHERRPFRQAVTEDRWYLNASRYHRQVTRYLDVFPADRLLILEMGEVVGDPEGAVQRVCAHIGLTPLASAGLSLSKRNASYRLNGMGRLLASGKWRRAGLGRAAALARATWPEGLYDWVRRRLTSELPQMTVADRRFVADKLAADTARFTALSGIDFAVRPDVAADQPQLVT